MKRSAHHPITGKKNARGPAALIRAFALVLALVLIPEFLEAAEYTQKLKPWKFKKRPRIALVLSGGGAKGIAHVGVLKIIEQSGLKIDCITGTSMGSIVGGLYASGYSAELLEKLVLGTDWDDLLADKIDRQSVSIDEKGEEEKYIGSFQISRQGIELPKGLRRGQKLSSMMSRLTLHVQHITDFDKLPIPFRCIGTDIVTGDAYVLKQGSLSDAMRASMSIPSIFTPIEIDNRLLVDGGIVRNLPVSDARDMGADIVIAIDVGAPLYKKDELKSVAEIMDQSVSFLGIQSTRQQRLLADILLMPDITGFTGQDFGKGKELIEVGEKAARLILPELKQLAEAQKEFPPFAREPITIIPTRKINVTAVEIRGLKLVSRNLVLGKLLINTPAKITPARLEEAIDRVYASGFFSRVTYRVEPAPGAAPDSGSVVLVIDVLESSGIFLRLGLSYDSNMNAAMLLNTTFRNVAGQGSTISLDARLSEFPGIRGSYFIYTGIRKPGLGFGAQLHYDAYTIFSYKGGNVESSYNYHNYGADIMAEAVILQDFAIGLGIQKDFTNILRQIAPNDPKRRDIEAQNYYAYLMFDNLDRTYYPRSGVMVYGEAKYLTDDLKWLKKQDSFKSFFKYMAKIKGYIPFHKRFSMYIGLTGGFIFAHQPYYPYYDVVNGLQIYQRKIPFIYQNYMGGLNTYTEGCFPFTGLNFMQMSGKNMLVLDTGFKIEFYPDLFLVLRGSVGRAKDQFEQLFQKRNLVIDQYYQYYIPKYQHLKNDLVYGYGLTFGYNSIIGPIELSLMRGSESNKFLIHVNVGYRI
jgi:NTE family protein